MTAIARVARSRMTFRVEVQRLSGEGGSDEDGYPLPPSWQVLHAALPCYAWSVLRREQATPTTTIVVNDIRLIVPKDADITEGDRLANIVDRLGEPYLPDILDVDAVVPRQTHREVLVRAVSP